MKAAGIICEFDPFHKGHAWLIERVREELAPDAVVCVMSGSFTQRGMPAAFGKFARARAAVSCGADLVLELPALYVLGSADQFAAGGVRVLSGLGCVEQLAFGSESGDAAGLKRAAEEFSDETPEFSAALRAALSAGCTYPAAYQKAAAEVFPELDASLLGSPNDLLALSYIRAAGREASAFGRAPLEPFAVKRKGAGHGSYDADAEFVSASFIREKLKAAGRSAEQSGPLSAGQNALSSEPSVSPDSFCGLLGEYLPEASLKELSAPGVLGLPSEERLFAMLMQKVLVSYPEELAKAPEVSEGLENRIKQAAETATDLESLIQGVKTKRYTYARVCRALMQILLGITREDLALTEKEHATYAKVLAFNAAGSKILRYAQERGNIPVLSNINKNMPSGQAAGRMLSLDILSGDIYTILCGRPTAEFSDKVRVPIIMTN